ncbi:hypothetical protein uav_007 [Pseudomonas phage UAVern]|uniref:Uncharacterized protein n=1 Tax=Pseudomonas phage UAVern TaxID=2856997 RepID=A0A975YYL4_9CAUD|nr:hypothetical protein uav_007 [Pseudomonas phage UAVern]
MEWLVIYFFVMVERIAAAAALGWVAFWCGLLLIFLTVAACAINTSNYPEPVTFTDNMQNQWAKVFTKAGKWCAILGLILGIVSYLLPTQKDLAIIVGSGVTYKAVTSETGKRLGGKAIDFLEKKIDDALGDDPKAPEAPQAPAKPEGKGQAL